MNSIYSLTNGKNKLWKEYNPKIVFNSENIIEKQILKTKSKLNNNFITKEFILSENHLFYLKNQRTKGYVDWNNIGLEYSKSKIRISLFSDKKYFSLYFDSLEIYKNGKKF